VIQSEQRRVDHPGPCPHEADLLHQVSVEVEFFTQNVADQAEAHTPRGEQAVGPAGVAEDAVLGRVQARNRGNPVGERRKYVLHVGQGNRSEYHDGKNEDKPPGIEFTQTQKGQ